VICRRLGRVEYATSPRSRREIGTRHRFGRRLAEQKDEELSFEAEVEADEGFLLALANGHRDAGAGHEIEEVGLMTSEPYCRDAPSDSIHLISPRRPLKAPWN